STRAAMLNTFVRSQPAIDAHSNRFRSRSEAPKVGTPPRRDPLPPPPPCVVRPPSAAAPLARCGRSLRGPGLRDDAAADAGESGDRVLSAISRELPDVGRP